jgi:hypothetical protein
MLRYNKSVIDWFLEQQLLSSDPVNNCILLCLQITQTMYVLYCMCYTMTNMIKFYKWILFLIGQICPNEVEHIFNVC